MPDAASKNGAPSTTETRQREENVTATNGSTTVGNIQIGGNLNGNMVIGNNNQVNSDRKK